MSAQFRRIVSALGVVAFVALVVGGSLFAAVGLNVARIEVATLGEQSAALQAREKRLPTPAGRNLATSASFEAGTVTLAGAALQQRVEAAVASAKGRLISARVDVESRRAEPRIALAVELTIAESDMQGLLFELETGRPYLFVDSFEARTSEAASEGGVMRVSLSLSGQWSAPK